jgi:hypothetical protein
LAHLSKNALILITVLLRRLSQTRDWQKGCDAYQSMNLSHSAWQFGRISDSQTDDGFHKAQFPPVYSWGLNVTVAVS